MVAVWRTDHLKHRQGLAQPPLRLAQLVGVVNEVGEGVDDLLVVAEVVKTYALLMEKKVSCLKWHTLANALTGMQ